MKTRTLGRTKLAVSEIGLGTEFLLGLPKATVIDVIHSATAAGVNYVDMFWAHTEFRDNMGEAFQGQRGKVFITAHLGSTIQQDGQYAISRDADVCSDFFHDYLKRMKTDYVDVLFLHNCNAQEDLQRVMDDGGLLDLARSFVKQGKARYVGLSGHNTVTTRQIVESGSIDVLMFPINLASYSVPGKPELLSACEAHNVGLVAMKVYGGGSLLNNTRAVELQDYQMGRQETAGAPSYYEKPLAISPIQCMAYVLDQPQVATTVPGPKSVEELLDALRTPSASSEEREYQRILPAFAQFATGECVYCNHCLPCPSLIDIGRTIRLSEQGQREVTEEVRFSYQEMETSASDCIECGQCAERCPFEVDVVAKMRAAVLLFA
ncbi:aldo/keto reductase [Candidatus Bipolaricaulota bacterium]